MLPRPPLGILVGVLGLFGPKRSCLPHPSLWLPLSALAMCVPSPLGVCLLGQLPVRNPRAGWRGTRWPNRVVGPCWPTISDPRNPNMSSHGAGGRPPCTHHPTCTKKSTVWGTPGADTSGCPPKPDGGHGGDVGKGPIHSRHGLPPVSATPHHHYVWLCCRAGQNSRQAPGGRQGV